MADSRSKNASRNIVFAFANKITSILLPFVSRTIMMYLLGENFLGINSLFTSVLSFLSLSELGLGSAIVFSMYKPVAEGDREKICALLAYYRKFYRKIGTVMLAIGTVLVPFIPYLIKGEAPEGTNVYILFYIYLLNSVISYFFAGYKQCLLTAHQRSDITSKITLVVSVVVRMGQILALVLTRNIYVYALVPIMGTILTNTLNLLVTDKMYPDLQCEGELSMENRKAIGKRLGGLVGTKLNSIVVHSADTLIISAFLGLAATAAYGNYYYIMNSVNAFVMLFFSSLTAGVGNSIITETLEKNYILFKKISFINVWISSWCSVCLFCLLHPFMVVWTRGKMVYPLSMEALIVIYFFIYTVQRTILVFKDAAGIWYEDRFRPYVCMIMNVCLNLLLVNKIGIYGVVGSSVLAFFISIPWVNHTLFRMLFRRGELKNLLWLGYAAAVTTGTCYITHRLCRGLPDSIGGIILRFGICLIVPNLLFLLCYGFRPEFTQVLHMFLSKIPKANKARKTGDTNK